MTVATPAVFAGTPSRPAGGDVLAPLDSGRIAANALAVSVHVVAGLLLMAPLAMPDWQPRVPSAQPIEWIPREPLRPVDPPPVQATPRPVPTPVQRPVERAAPVVISAPVPAEAGDLQADAEPAPAHDLPFHAPVGYDIAPQPQTGVTLRYADAPAPRYPPRALRERRSGLVILEVLVDVDGLPVDVTVAQSSGHRDLDRAAQRQVLVAWRFRPAMRNGVAVRAIGRVPVEFNAAR